MCIGIYIFNLKTKAKKAKKIRRQKAKETKGEKKISVENLTGYISKFALCTFNLLDGVVNFTWMFK